MPIHRKVLELSAIFALVWCLMTGGIALVLVCTGMPLDEALLDAIGV